MRAQGSPCLRVRVGLCDWGGLGLARGAGCVRIVRGVVFGHYFFHFILLK